MKHKNDSYQNETLKKARYAIVATPAYAYACLAKTSALELFLQTLGTHVNIVAWVNIGHGIEPETFGYVWPPSKRAFTCVHTKNNQL